MESNTPTQNILENICLKCLYMFQNAQLINNQQDTSETMKSQESSTSLQSEPTSSESRNNSSYKSCTFCFGILNPDNFKKIIENIFTQLDDHEYNDYKITTNFSPLFQLVIAYWKNTLKKSLQKEELNGTHLNIKDIDSLDVSLIRKIFKPIFLPFLNEKLGKEKKVPYNIKSSFEIKIIFEFPEKFYDKIFEVFSIVPIVRKLGHKKFKPEASMDRSGMNELIKSCSCDLLTELVNKNKLFANQNLEMKTELINQNIYIKGNYLKFSREIGQSPWEVKGEKICYTSVEEEMTKTLKGIFNCDNCIMSAGGREDRDVRMLGSGRPFIIEIVNPRIRNKPLGNVSKIEQEINLNSKLIQVKNLDVCDKNYFAVIKKYEDSKQKLYTCLVWTSKIITNEDIELLNGVRDLTIIQKTPMRVMHRRTLMDRKKAILKLEASQINENFLIIHVLASAGTYIKEFIHSDLGRTTPSLMTLLNCECDILQLDVLDIIYDNM